MRLTVNVTTIFVVILLGITTLGAQKRISHREYIKTYKNLALQDQDIYGIPASITMAQGLLESDCGNSRLAIKANNHFGIKCKRDWTGATILHDDDAKDECFRSYTTVEESYRDHSEFLDKSPRYQELFELDISDYKGWAHGLRKAGYATNPRYAQLLIKLIEEHQLYLLDSGVDYAAVIKEPIEEPTTTFTPTQKVDIDNYMVAVHTLGSYPIYTNNGSEFVVAQEGDTFESIAKLARISEKRIRKFNDATRTSTLKAGDQVYIRAKSNRAANGKLIHIVKDGDTMHSISQQYAIKLKRLAKMNLRSTTSTLTTGQQIRLL